MRPDIPPHPRDLVGEAELDESLDEPLPFLIGGKDRRSGRSRQEREDLRSRGSEPGLPARDVGRVGGKRQHDREPREHGFEGRHAGLGALHTDVNV
jgi:hypothetical protein